MNKHTRKVELTAKEQSMIRAALDYYGDSLADSEGYSSGEKYWDLKEKLDTKTNLHTHRVIVSLEDDEIERTTATLLITTKDSLATVSKKLNTAFEKFDSFDGSASEHYEHGWGVDSFVDYLKHRYRKGWVIEEVIPDATFEFYGT